MVATGARAEDGDTSPTTMIRTGDALAVRSKCNNCAFFHVHHSDITQSESTVQFQSSKVTRLFAAVRRLGLLIQMVGILCRPVVGQPQIKERVVVPSDSWQLVGDLIVPDAEDAVPAVILFNQAAGDRTVYAELASLLAERGIASLRLDLRGHGESTNLGTFVPGKRQRDPMIWDAEADVRAAHAYLRSNRRLDPRRIAMVGASYSGEEMAEAGRTKGYAQAYVALSPGSFSEKSAAAIDSSGVPWLFVVANGDPYLTEIAANVRQKSSTVEMVIVPGTGHASDLLSQHQGLAERIAVWLDARLNSE